MEVDELQVYPLWGSMEDGLELAFCQHMDSEVWKHLPEEVLHRVLHFLPMRSICRFRLVCRPLRGLLSSGEFFKSKALVVDPSPPVICMLGIEWGWNHAKRKEGPPRHRIPATPPKPYRWGNRAFLTSKVREASEFMPPEQDVFGPVQLIDGWNCAGSGLFCASAFSGLAAGKMFVVNPATRTFRMLPERPDVVPLACGIERVALDEPFGTTFTVTWDWEYSSAPRRSVVVIYASRTNTWIVQTDVAGEDEHLILWCSVLCNGKFFRLVTGRSGKRRVVVYSVDTDRLVRFGEAPVPESIDQGPFHEFEGVRGDWRAKIVDVGLKVYLVAGVVSKCGRTLCGIEIWKLDDVCLKFHQVAVIPTQLFRQLYLHKTALSSSIRICGACAVGGEVMCIQLKTCWVQDDYQCDGFNHDCEDCEGLTHVLAFSVNQQSWQLLYSETDDEGRLVPLEAGQRSDDRTALPESPLMVPNFHLFL